MCGCWEICRSKKIHTISAHPLLHLGKVFWNNLLKVIPYLGQLILATRNLCDFKCFLLLPVVFRIWGVGYTEWQYSYLS